MSDEEIIGQSINDIPEGLSERESDAYRLGFLEGAKWIRGKDASKIIEGYLAG